MKKLILTLGLGLCLTTAFAQINTEDREVGSTTKMGQKILPQTGDFAVGIDASPALKYVGNIFNGNTNNNADNVFGYNKNVFDAPSIYGKYFLSDNSAIRAKLHLGFTSDKKVSLVDKVGTTDDTKVENDSTVNKSGLGLTLGYEIRRGYGRLQGYFGPEVGIGFQSKSTSYNYAEGLSNGNTNLGSNRFLKRSPQGSTFTVKVGGFVGVEYFIAPKISLGAEYGLAIAYSSIGKGKTETERWDIANDKKVTKETETGSSSDFKFQTLSSGSLNLTFHF